MDPSSISSPSASAPPTATVPFAADPNNHPPPPPAPADNPAHPPYAEMIYTAIGALKEKDGSSKRAINKYIEQVYKDQLTQSHESLLTHHLKRLKTNGMLVMDKKSYKLPGSAPPILPPPPENIAVGAGAAPSPASRPRGRPRKVQPPQHLPQPLPLPGVQLQPQPPPQQQVQPEAQPQPQNLPPQFNNVQQNAAPAQNAEPVWAALGLADDPVAVPVTVQVQGETSEGTKRRPGRPRKSPAVAAAGLQPGQPGPSSATPRRRGRPPGSKSAKKLGRPKAEPAAAAAVAADPSLPKRRPGRPPKNQPGANPIPFAALPPEAPAVEAVAAPVVAPEGSGARRRGRPRKNAYAVVVASAVPVTSVAGRGRGRGRPRGSGRKPGGGLTMQHIRRAGKRPVGRPRKDATAAAASTSQNVANEDLRRKLEHFQSKVKESVAVLKPHFNHESPVTAIAAIQELEELGNMDLNAPLRDETLPQQQQPQVLPQEAQPQQQVPQQQVPPLQQVPPQQPAYQQQYPPFHMQQYHHLQQQQPFQHP